MIRLVTIHSMIWLDQGFRDYKGPNHLTTYFIEERYLKRQIKIVIFDVILVRQKLQNEFRNIQRILFITHLIILSNSNSSHDHDEHLQFSQLNFLTLHVLSDIYCVPLSQQTANL